jgi:hypothetical protein
MRSIPRSDFAARQKDVLMCFGGDAFDRLLVCSDATLLGSGRLRRRVRHLQADE